ncbi:MAG: hypothetical protein ACREMS_03390 [Gemmatimonadaceae bacterium]
MGKILAAGVVGVVVGFGAQYYQALAAWSIVPWGIIGIAIGVWCSRRESFYAGALYGFCLCFFFMVGGYTGAASVFSRIPFFAVIGLFGAVCGIAAAVTGFYLKAAYGRRTPKP